MEVGVGLLGLALLTVSCLGREDQIPAYIECTSSSHCLKLSACVIGHAKFSLPRCTPMAEEGSSCRPGAEPLETSLTYPDGATVRLRQVYLEPPPCQPGLVCSREQGICLAPAHLAHNYIDY